MNPGSVRNREMLKKLDGTSEPYFVLRAQDALASALVMEWADRAEGAGCPQDIVADARMQARAMRQWPKKKIPD
jgi:hypothetical protein